MLLDDDVRCWNAWREENPELSPNLSELTLSRRHLEGVNLSRCNLSGTHFNRTDLRNANLFRANISNASLKEAILDGANCCEMYAAGADLGVAQLARADVRDANLADAHLTGANLNGADLSRSDLSRANLFQASLARATLRNAKLAWCNLTEVNLVEANLQSCDMTGVNIIEADLTAADLRSANLRYARFIESKLDLANLSGCRVYGVSVWNVTSENAIQSDLIITPADEVTISVDTFEVAQFIYLLLNNSNVRKAVDTISSKVVLILGRFAPERIAILQVVKECLRARGYLPLLFDFLAPSTRDLTETIATLAHLSHFVLADLTDARSLPQELMAIVPNLPSVPIKPLLLESQSEYGMFEHFKRYPWVLETSLYRNADHLLNLLSHDLIESIELAASRRRL